MKMKKVLTTVLSLALVACLSIVGTIAYLQDDASDVNVMTLGNVSIEQHEYERVVEDGKWVSTGETDKYGYTPDKLQEFTQDKPLYPAYFADGNIKWDDRNGSTAEDGTGHQQSWGQIGASGSNQLFDDSVKNVQDKFVFVENTGKSNAYVRTLIAFEQGAIDGEKFDDVIMTNFDKSHWELSDEWIPDVEIEGNKYIVVCATYLGPKSNPTGILEPGTISYPSLLQVYMRPEATNEDVEAIDGNGDGKYNILVVSQAAQTNGFANATAALNEAFGDPKEKDNLVKWFAINQVNVTPDNLEDVDFTAPGQTYRLSGQFGDLAINELGEGSVLSLDNANIGALSLGDDATIEGDATIASITVKRNSVDPITVTLSDAKLNVTGAINVENTEGLSTLNIEKSEIKTTTISVGAHVNNHRAALAELNISSSKVSCEENGLGSTISVWGWSGVKSNIEDSEIYTYSRGWHQSEDANDNAITFQSGKSNVINISRTNMHLYGARSIVNARNYGGGDDYKCDFNIDESLIWTVTKSSHGDETIPVWGDANITDSILLFTKNVHKDTPAVFHSFVYGNPVIHGDYHVTTQCQWAAPIELADGQTVTFASDANVSVYDGAGEVKFVGGEVKLETGAVVENIGY